ncbi:hypothetical protein ACWEJ6_52270 [Nonomuraea sp. NPDC004702]
MAHLEGLERAVLADVLEDVLDFVPILFDRPSVAASQEQAASGATPAADLGGAAQQEPGPPQDPDTASSVTMALAVYHVAAGADVLIGQEGIGELLALAENSPGGAHALECVLCDQPIDLTPGAEVNLGLAISQTGGGPDHPGLLLPAWTHPDCGRARVWAQAQLNAARLQAGLPVWGDDPVPQSTDPGRESDWFTSSRVRHRNTVFPLLVIQPGAIHPYGTPGHVADMLRWAYGRST